MVAVVALGLWWIKPEDAGVPAVWTPSNRPARHGNFPVHHPCGSQFRIPNHTKVERICRKKRVAGSTCLSRGSTPNCIAPRCLSPTWAPCCKTPSRWCLAMKWPPRASDAKPWTVLPRAAYSTHWKGRWPPPCNSFVTDSVDHFMRGSLYFSHKPNSDSVAPVLQRLEADVRIMMETMQWP